MGGGFLTNNNGGFGGGMGGGFGGGYQDSFQNSGTKGNAGVSPMKGERDRKKGSIIPLTIKTILEVTNRPDDVIEVDGIPVDQAVVLGRVYKMEDQSTRTIFHIDDTTGRIQIAYYKKTDAYDRPNGGMQDFYYNDNMYIKAVVVVKPFKAQKIFVSNMLQTVTDFNQVSYHFLSTFLASAYRVKGPLPKPDPNFGSNNNQNSTQNQGNNDMSMGNQGNQFNQPMGGGGPQQQIKNAIDFLQKSNQTGVCKLSKLVQFFQGKMDLRTIQGHLTIMESNAMVYSDQDERDPGYYPL